MDNIEIEIVNIFLSEAEMKLVNITSACVFSILNFLPIPSRQNHVQTIWVGI